MRLLGKFEPLVKFRFVHVVDLDTGLGVFGNQFVDQGFKVGSDPVGIHPLGNLHEDLLLLRGQAFPGHLGNDQILGHVPDRIIPGRIDVAQHFVEPVGTKDAEEVSMVSRTPVDSAWYVSDEGMLVIDAPASRNMNSSSCRPPSALCP